MKIPSGIKRFAGALSLLLLVYLLLSACGSGGSGSSSSPAAVQTTAVAGIAAAGAPLAGKVHLCDSSVLKIYSSNSTINQDGSFSINTTGMNAPFILRAVDAAGNPLYYSFARAPGIANINPLTNLALAMAAGNTTLATLYASHTVSEMDAVSGVLPGTVSHIMHSLRPLLALYHADTADPLSGLYQVNNQGLDGLFDDVLFSVSNGTGNVNITYTQTTPPTTIFTGVFGNMTSSALTNLPAQKTYVTPGNAELTLKVQGKLPHGTVIRNVSFSVQLPLGITVEIDPSDPGGLTSVVNTAVPVGPATGANIFPAPTLSTTNNILTVSMSSVAGFGVGNFIKIRCLVSSPLLMAATTPGSFSVTSSTMYADIYNNKKLKGFTIVPDKFTALP
ncbi:MAG: hypothetical protein ABSA06_00260 [Geobacteraceae bacterium]|jgi:hypothetical protein